MTSRHTNAASITPIKRWLIVRRGVSWLSPWSRGVCEIILLGFFEMRSAIGWRAFWICVANQEATPLAKQFVSKGLHREGATGVSGLVTCSPKPPAPLPLPRAQLAVGDGPIR